MNWFVSSYLLKIAKESDSVALESDALHLRTDVYTSAGVLAGLIAIHFTGLTILDPVIAMGVVLLTLGGMLVAWAAGVFSWKVLGGTEP